MSRVLSTLSLFRGVIMCRVAALALLATGLVIATAPVCAADAEADLVRKFFAHPDYSDVRLSPSGNYLGALVPAQGRLRLAVVDLASRTSKIVAAMEGDDIAGFDWVNDDRLVFSVADLQEGLGVQTGGGLFAVNRDGSLFRELAPTVRKVMSTNRFVYRYTRPLSLLHDGGDDILVVSNETNARYPDVYRLNTRSGRRTLVSVGKPGDVVQWVADRQGNVRAAVVQERGTRNRVFWRASGDGDWVEIGSYAINESQMVPLDFDADGTLLVGSDIGRDTAAIYRYDAQKRALGELVVAHPQADLLTTLVHDVRTQRVVGVRYEADRAGEAWFDVDYARLQKGVDAALPDHFNRISKAGSRVLIESFSDTDPGRYYLLDTEKNRLEPVAVRRKAIDPAEMPHRQPVRYKARDGLEIPAYLTLPPRGEAKNLPLVLLVHGGPWLRGGHWRWNPEAAYLATLGYAVLEADFRGSTGWGRKLHVAGWKQWGLAMQDDLNDGMDWLAAQGTIDPKRACIMGASYGGYAVMMGLARDPDRFRCGINYVGVTDINLMFDVTWSDFAGSDFIRYSAKEMIGDPDADRARLQNTSPLRNAAKIKSPVFMAYGGQDYRVPVIHGERMRDALAANGTAVEWVVYPEEGHGFMREANRFDFYRRVAQFLAKNLRGSP
ncbi:MAG: S9 family peptidase [Pseudomonadota bacterium]|nr:S9 family peptidase [Pseudomonadota bacterium]